MHAAGRVLEAGYEPPLLSGMVKDGLRTLRSGLRVKTFSDVENLCTCRESRQWGKICAHSLAVGLAHLDPAKAPALEPARPRAEVPQPPAPRFVEIGAQEDATPIALHFILPPNFESAWDKRQIMLVTEIERAGQRVMPTTLSPNETYACDNHDLAALDLLESRWRCACSSAPSSCVCWALYVGIRASPSEKRKQRRSLPGSDRPRLRLSRPEPDTVLMELEVSANDRLLVAGAEAWMWRGASFHPLPENLPSELQRWQTDR